jgi:hypothetical protein
LSLGSVSLLNEKLVLTSVAGWRDICVSGVLFGDLIMSSQEMLVVPLADQGRLSPRRLPLPPTVQFLSNSPAHARPPHILLVCYLFSLCDSSSCPTFLSLQARRHCAPAPPPPFRIREQLPVSRRPQERCLPSPQPPLAARFARSE